MISATFLAAVYDLWVLNSSDFGGFDRRYSRGYSGKYRAKARRLEFVHL